MNLERLITTRGLVQKSPSAEDIRSRAQAVSPEPIKLFYGETYDDKGNPIDSIKYYLFVANVAKSLSRGGFNTDPSILIADTAACRNVGARLKDDYMRLGENRVRFVNQVNDTYGTGLRVVKMSDYIDSPEFIRARDEIMNFCSQDEELMQGVEKTVPESKVEVEREKGFMYSYDEITTIIDLDVKVGPPREDLYDDIARKIAKAEGKKELMSLFLTPTFPLGVNWTYFFKNEGIEDHGITAYKAGSKRLQWNRIIVGKTSPEQVRELIATSFISNNPELPNPILDLGIITEMARKRLEKDDSPITLADDFYSGKIGEKSLREYVSEGTDKHILSLF